MKGMRVNTEPTGSLVGPENKGRVVREYGKSVDFGKTSEDYARFRPGPPGSMYERLGAFVKLAGARVVDVGTGTGAGAIELAARGARVVGIDPSAEQLEAARGVARARGVDVEFRVGKAESLELADASVDVYFALQCWHWFEPVQAAREAFRVVKPGGVAVCANFDYLPNRSRVAKRTEELIMEVNPAWPMSGGNGVHVNPLNQLPAAGFTGAEVFSFEHPQEFTHEAWRGRMRTCNGVGASLGAEKVKAFDEKLGEMLKREFPVEPMVVEHRVWVVVARKPG